MAVINNKQQTLKKYDSNEVDSISKSQIAIDERAKRFDKFITVYICVVVAIIAIFLCSKIEVSINNAGSLTLNMKPLNKDPIFKNPAIYVTRDYSKIENDDQEFIKKEINELHKMVNELYRMGSKLDDRDIYLDNQSKEMHFFFIIFIVGVMLYFIII